MVTEASSAVFDDAMGARAPRRADIWGVTIRVNGVRVESSTPGWQLNAQSTYSAIRHVQHIAQALAAAPEAYGFDPDATYTLLFQTWDRAVSATRSLAFGRNIVGHGAVGLVPDVYYIDQFGFRGLHDAVSDAPRWALRSDVVAWRGSVTGTGPYHAADEIPRLRLARSCRDIAGTDVKIIGVHETMASIFPPERIADVIATHRLAGECWRQTDFGRYKFVIDIDGHANAWGFLEKLILGCCVIKIGSPYEQWYYRRLRPWVHYVPARADLSDLAEVIAWCRDNDAQCAWIGRNAARLAQTLTAEADLPHSCRAFMAAAHVDRVVSAAWPGGDGGRGAYQHRILASAFLWRHLGRLDDAVSDYTRLAEAGLGDAEVMLGRSSARAEQGDLAAAAEDIAAAIAGIARDADALVQVARAKASVGQDAEAVRWFREAVRLAPSAAEARIDLAAACLRLDWLDIGHAAVRDPPAPLADWRAELRRIVVERHVARRDGAIALLRMRRATGDLPRDQWFDLAVRLYSLGRLTAARALCDRLAGQAPDDFAPRDLAGLIVWRQDGAAAAVRHLRALPEEFHARDAHAIRLAQRLHDLGHFGDVLDVLAERPAIRGNDDVRLMRAVACLMLRRMPELRAHCRAWMDAAPDAALPARIMCSTQLLPARPAPVDVPSTLEIVLGRFRGATDETDSWRDHHPGIRCQDHDAAGARDYLCAEYDRDVVDAFDLCEPAVKAAYFRIAWLHRTGGVWIAPHQQCIEPMGSILAAAARSECSAVREGGSMMGHLEDSFLGARSGSALMAQALIEATAMIRAAANAGRPLAVWDAIGPGLITRTVGRRLATGETAGTDLFLLAMPLYRRYVRTAPA